MRAEWLSIEPVKAEEKLKGKEEFSLLFQLISEEDPNLMWCDNGLVYIHYNKNTKEIKGELQCC